MVNKFQKKITPIISTCRKVISKIPRIVKNSTYSLLNILVVKKAWGRQLQSPNTVERTITEVITNNTKIEPNNDWIRISDSCYSTLRDYAINKRNYNAKIWKQKQLASAAAKQVENTSYLIQVVQLATKFTNVNENKLPLHFQSNQDALFKNFLKVVNTKYPEIRVIKPAHNLKIENTIVGINNLNPYLIICGHLGFFIAYSLILHNGLKIIRLQQLRAGAELPNQDSNTGTFSRQFEKIKTNRMIRYLFKYRMYFIIIGTTGLICFLARKSITLALGTFVSTSYNLLLDRKIVEAEDAIEDQRKKNVTKVDNDGLKKDLKEKLKVLRREKLREKYKDIQKRKEINKEEKRQIQLERKKLIDQNDLILEKYGQEKLVSVGLRPQAEVIEEYKKEKIREEDSNIPQLNTEINTELTNEISEEDNEIIEL